MKRLIYLFFILSILLTNLPVNAYTPACTSPSFLPFGTGWISMTAADPDEVKGNDEYLQTPVVTICMTDLPLLAGKADNETITGNWAFTGMTSINGDITLSNNGVTGTTFGVDVDNAAAEASPLCLFVNRGSTSALDPALCWTTGGIAKIVTDKTTLALDKLQVADGASGNDVTTYQQVPKLTTANTLTALNTFSLAPISNTAASAANELMRRGETIAADAAIVAGMCTQGSGAPVGSCTAGACYYDIAVTTAPVEWYCQGPDNMTWVKTDLDSIDTTNPIISSTDVDFTGTPEASATDSLIGLGIDIASGSANGTFLGINKATFTGDFINAQVAGASKFKVDNTGALTVSGTISGVSDPSTAQQAATKTYVDTSSPKKFASTASVTLIATTPTTVIGSGTGSLVIAANTLMAGSVIKLHAYGIVTTDASAGTLTFVTSAGGDFISNNPITLANNLTNAYWEYHFTGIVRTIGVSGTILPSEIFWSSNVSDATSSTASIVMGRALNTAVTRDTTGALTVDLKMNWSAAESLVCDQVILEIYN